MIPARAGVNVELLHPILRRRLDALHADPRTRGRLSIYSGVRTYAHQKRLYDDWVAGRRKDVAANPERVIGDRTFFGVSGIAQGSWHMAQPRLGGWGYAADLAGYDAGTEAIAREYGLLRTVPSEQWHYQPDYSSTPFDSPTDPTEVDMAEGRYVRNQSRMAYSEGTSLLKFASSAEAKDHREFFDPDDKIPNSIDISDALWATLDRG